MLENINTQAMSTTYPKVIALTGGIGSGKSTLCELLSTYGIPSIDTDQIARQVVMPNSAGLTAVTEKFGESILNADSTLNRAELRKIIFNDASKKQQLEAILHPLIQAETKRQIEQMQNPDSALRPALILVAIPLLTEVMKKTGIKPGYIDEIWVIDTSVEQQRQQASVRDGVSLEQIEKIINQQAKREDRLKIADHVIQNNGDIRLLEHQVSEVLKKYAIN